MQRPVRFWQKGHRIDTVVEILGARPLFAAPCEESTLGSWSDSLGNDGSCNLTLVPTVQRCMCHIL
jgi:hypothetical protein